MGESIKAAIVVVGISIFIVLFFFRAIVSFGANEVLIKNRLTVYFVSIVALFLAPNAWIAFAIIAVVAVWAGAKEYNPVALYVFSILLLPDATAPIPGLGVFQQVITVGPHRLIALLVLLPAAYKLLSTQSGSSKLKLHLLEKFQITFFALYIILNYEVSSFTNVIRVALVYPFLDAFLLTFVAARTLNKDRFWDFVGTLVFGGLILSGVALFEATNGWLLYESITQNLSHQTSSITNYLLRDGILRAKASTAHSIVLGYTIMLCLLAVVAARSRLSFTHFTLLTLTLVIGSVSTISRGPWVGAIVGIVVLACISSNRKFIWGAVLAVSSLVAPILFTEYGAKLVRFLPYFGDVDAENVEYRSRLLEIAAIVIAQNPFFGAYDFMLRPELEEMRQGQGIIDIVNSYVGIILSGGLVALTLFISCFVLAIKILFDKARTSGGMVRGTETLPLQFLMAAIFSIMFTIFSVSSIGIIPQLYWLVLGASISMSLQTASA